MENRIRSDQPLYQYIFCDGKLVSFNRCNVVGINPVPVHKDGKYGRRITYEKDILEGRNDRFYVYEEDIDKRLATSGHYKVAVLTEPNGNLARDILVKHLSARYDEYAELALSMERQLEAIMEEEL